MDQVFSFNFTESLLATINYYNFPNIVLLPSANGEVCRCTATNHTQYQTDYHLHCQINILFDIPPGGFSFLSVCCRFVRHAIQASQFHELILNHGNVSSISSNDKYIYVTKRQ